MARCGLRQVAAFAVLRGSRVDIVFGIIGLALIIVPLWRICARAGFSPWLSLLVIVPVFGFILVAAILAFADWPAGKADPQV